MSVEGEGFGQRRPPLYHLIKNILREYPNGQVFKEIIQNADDARATEVKFYLDCRNLSTLPHELVRSGVHSELDRFQGPALMCYNNAQFREEDWESIQNLQQSGKAKNPHKVGKFGIGFNSVYHISDLPVIISDKYCGYLEPQEHMWKGESGRRYTLTELQSSCPQALFPYDGVAGFSSHTHSFNGQTLFRFPLRNKPSNLSSEVSTIDSVRQLLHALKDEAKFLLLFLRSVCSIEVIEILDTHKQQTSFKVSISSRDALLHKQQQQSLVKQVETTFTGSSSNSIEYVIQQSTKFSIELYNNGVITEHEWLVVHRVGSEDKEVLALAQQQNVIPWVGTAVEIGKQCDISSKGRIFCCIPLPTEDRAPFNVCVNGTFAVSSNRRSLNWESQERQGDSEGLWNKYLVEKCLPHCYCELILQVMKIPSILPETVYQCWPVTHHVKQTPWEGLLKPLFVKLLYSKSVVHANPSDWISLSNAALVPYGTTLPDSVQVLLVSLGMRIVALTSEQWNIVNDYYSSDLHTITPRVVRGLMRKNERAYSAIYSFSKKIQLLQYCLSDRSYSDLSDLELIPVANGTFSKFSSPRGYSYSSSHSDTPFVCTSSIRHDLLPGVDHVMVDLLDNDATTHAILIEIAGSNETQLTVVNESVIAKLVPQSNPAQSWSQSQLEKFWKWLQNYDLNAFNGLQIVPVKHTNGQLSIHNLTKQSSLVFVSRYASQMDLTANLRSALEKYGVNLACEIDFPYVNHSQLSSYCNQFVVGEVVDCTQLHAVKCNQLTEQEASAMLSFLIKCPINFHRINKLCEMNIFSVIQDASNRFSVNQVKTREQGNVALAQGNDFLFRTDLLPKHPMIFKSGQLLLRNLTNHVMIINDIECLEKVAFVSIRNRSLPVESIIKFMLSVLDNLCALIRYPNQSLLNTLSSLPFISVESGLLMAPSSLFDPRDKLLVQLYQTEHVFPSESFLKYIDELVLCGLSNSKSVTASMMNDILYSISVHSGWCGGGIVQCDATTISRVNTFFKLLTEYPHLLNDPIGGYRSLLLKESILHRATSHALFPVASVKPIYYPSSLSWMGSEHSNSLAKYDSSHIILLANTVNHSCNPNPTIVGSKVYFVENIPQLLCSYVPKSNLANCVLQHFQHVIDNESKLDSDTLEQIAIKTYDYLSSTSINSVTVESVGKLIWIESCSKFVEPHLCVLNNNIMFNNTLEPFVYILTRKLRKYEDLFCRFGVNKLLQYEQIVSVLTSIKTNHMNISSNEAWTLVKSILDWLVATKVDSDNVLVPITCDNDNSYPDLHPVSEVCYTDNEMLLEIAKSSDEEYKLVHPSIAHLASQFSLTPLSDQLDITEDVFQDAGQHEPLTTRLSNILREYKDGLTIIKELVQNADDAEATEVSILYDARQHTTDRLLFKGMADSHGPALVVHNNATFTEEDFVNITKLAGATKKDKPLKIGKFGVGFCSVYHITDVPSFVSGEWLYIFDPTLNHLKGVVKNDNQPGKRVKYSSKFVSKSKQLTPYENLFQFSPSESYNGTMFRFPFRTHASQISSTIYSESMIDALKNDIAENGKKMLLFLSHVKTLNFVTIQAGNSSQINQEIMIVKIECGGNIVRVETKLSARSSNPTVEYWLVSSVSNSVYDVYENKSRPSVSSVACQLLMTTDGKYKVVPVDGSVFCYLPLSVPCSGLPVHISANFAVMSNRSGIWTSSSSATPSDSREWWNQQLMETIIPEAYCNLLVMLKHLQNKGMLLDYNFYELFPLISELKVHHPWKTMIENMYSKVLKEKLYFCKCLGKWLHLNECQFLSRDVLSMDENVIPKCVVDSVQIMKLPIVDLPKKHLQQFQLTSTLNVINEEGFCQIFFSNIFEFLDYFEIRNKVLHNMYLVASRKYNMHGESCILDMLKNNPSVPCTPHGINLKLASSLIDSHCELKELFDSDSEMFPCQSFTNSKPVHQLMIEIGLMNTTLPWDIIVECAKSIETVYTQDKDKALKRIKIILKCIGEKLNAEKNYKSKKQKRFPSEDFLHVLKDVKFIPVASKPDNYISLWKGGEMTLSSPCRMFYPHPSSIGYGSKRQYNIGKECFLLGSQKIIANSLPLECGGCGSIPHSVVEALGFQIKPNIEEIVDNYVCLTQHFEIQKDWLNERKIRAIEFSCRISYEFLENELKKSSESESQQTSKVQTCLTRFQDLPFVWNGKKFISPENIATRWKEKGPYLYELPSLLSESELLIKALCICHKFTIKKLLKTLEAMFVDFDENKLDKNCSIITSNAIINELNSYKPDDYKDIDKDCVILPSASYELLHAKGLSFNDSQWLPVSDDCILVHPILTRAVALALGVNPVRSQFLDKYVSSGAQFGSEFGQREGLTQRIKNILRDYPLDATLIKELLQNADDAKATKMCIILDKRKHGTERIPSKEWSELQGPALLVWNNEEFSQKDLEGIQKLGLGSKRNDSESIGQFGIGFNVVYHVTDCPSLITGGKTLCVFDPHCKYAPGASPLNPGRRYDDLENTFWNVMSDLKSAYFQCDSITNQPSDIINGSLFRLPLRNITMESKIEANPSLTVSYLEKELDDWVLQIKHALVFLNHISEFSYYVVDNSGFHLRDQYQVKMDSNAVMCRQCFIRTSDEFKKVLKPCFVNYKISMECIQPNRVPSAGTAMRSPSALPIHLNRQEEWFIQQGIGDVNKDISQQKWRFIDRVLPKHGIASPIHQTSSFKGKIFCFLPLPSESGLPVHINGQFVLSSNRRSLWAGDPESIDKKKEWNDNLMEAIASSYVHYLTEARHVFVEDREYTDIKILHQGIINYYRLFQNLEGTLTFNNTSGLNFAQLVTKNLWKLNPKVLALEPFIKSKNNTVVFKVDWNNLIEEKNPFNQYYFQPNCENKKEIIPLLKTVKMKLTCAPNFLYKQLIFDQNIPTIATPASVFDFYCRFHHLILSHVSLPCKLTETPFRNLQNVLAFVKYLLLESDIYEKVFPKSPFGCPLLLTEDLVLRCFDTEPTIMRTRFANLFPNSLSAFLHDAFLGLGLSSSYFVNNSEIALTRIDELMVKNYSIKLKQEVCNNKGQCVIEFEKLKNIWNCLTSQDDRFLQNFYREILHSWALLPAKDGRLFSTKNPILPIQLEESLLNNDKNFRQVERILKHVGFPELDANILPIASSVAGQILPIPSMNNYDEILTMLYHLQSEMRVLDNLSSPSNDSEHLLSYLSRTSFRSNTELKQQLKTLPLFKTTTGSLTSLSDKKVYLWPSHEFCVAGFTTWAPSEAVVFLHVLGNWKLLKTDFDELGYDIDELGIYAKLIMPKFQELTSDEKYQHMKYLRDSICPTLKNDIADKARKDKNQIAEQFLQQLKSLKCITHANTNQVETVGYFCDDTISIFKMFPGGFNFLPVKYQGKEWLEFLCYLGLQTKVSADDFITFCHIVENGEHDNPPAASQLLVEYLLTEGQKWDDSYLNQIAEIRFVQVAESPSLTWIKASCSPPLLLQSSGVGLTSFREGIVSDQAKLIWTVKPVFELSHWRCFIRDGFFETLQITTTPTPEDVLQNLINMSKSGLSNSELFFKYNPQYIFKESTRTHIIDIFTKSVSFLWEHNPSLLPQLKTYTCIPVSVDHDRHDKPDKVVLVKPISVVTQFNQPEDVFLKPYVHEIPTCLKNRLEIFNAIGVLKAIDLEHIQHLLKSLYKKIGTNILDPNQVKAIRYCILKLSNLISRTKCNEDVVVDSLSPLYLPSKTGSSWTLHKSNDLAFADSIRYTVEEVQKFNFMIAGYPLFNIPQDHTSNIRLQSAYLTQLSIPPDEKSFCCSLPKQLRPLELSLHTVEKKLPVGNTSQKKNILEFSLLQMLEFLDPLEHIFTKMVEQHKLKYETQILPTTVVSCLMSFLRTLEVTVINGLQASVTLNGNEIGSLSAPTFVLDKDDDHYILYISEAARNHDCSLTELSHFILMEIARILNKNVTTFSVLIEPFKKCLQIQSNVSLKCLAETYGLQVGSVEVNNKVQSESNKDDLSKPIPGKVMPLEFVRRLDRSIDNIYLPEEWVGYEVTEQNFVWAIILEQKDDENSTVTKEYMILSSIDDIKGHLVSALDLYKIMPLHVDIKNYESKEVVLYDKKCTSTTASNLKERFSLIQLKKRICEELEMLRGLTSDKQKKGIRRLYIKYHPDKCDKGDEEVYEEVFKFLLRQIELLEEGSPLENPETESSREAHYTASETESSFRAHYTPSNAWSSFYDRWNEHVPKYNYSRGYRNSNYFFEQFQSRPSPTIAKHWLKQAEADSVAMTVLKNDRSHVCQVIFLAHEVVEKSLKAGMHALLGLNILNLANHNLRYFAESIRSVVQEDSYISLVEIADRLSPYYERSRYPDKHMNLRAPVDVYELHEAEEAAELAMIALEFIERKIN